MSSEPTDIAPNTFLVTCIKENEDGSADIVVEMGSETRQIATEEGITFLMIKGILEGTTEDIFRWAQLGKQQENTK